MLKLTYDNLYGTSIHQVNELEFENDHYNLVATNIYPDDLSGLPVVEKTFQCREERKQLYLYCNNEVTFHYGSGHDIEEEFLIQEAI